MNNHLTEPVKCKICGKKVEQTAKGFTNAHKKCVDKEYKQKG